MFRKLAYMTVSLAILPMTALAAEDSAEVAAVVASVKSANPDIKALCQKGPDGIRKAATEAVMTLMTAGKLKGNPQAIGGEAGQAIGRECRG